MAAAISRSPARFDPARAEAMCFQDVCAACREASAAAPSFILGRTLLRGLAALALVRQIVS
jgi:hypothetical protein